MVVRPVDRPRRRCRRPDRACAGVTNPFERSLQRLDRALRGDARRYALVGGLAVSSRAEPRLTRDADVAVSVGNDLEAETVVLGLARHGYRTVATVVQEAVGRLATVRLVHDDDGGMVTDLLFASSGIEPEIVGAAESLDVTPSLHLPVATVGHLIATKLLARDDRRRPADADDLRALRSVATTSDWDIATASVDLIRERGFARGRDLSESLSQLRAVGPY